MGKAAVRACVTVAVIAAILQTVALFGEWFRGSQFIGLGLGYVKYKFGLHSVTIEAMPTVSTKVLVQILPYFATWEYCGSDLDSQKMAKLRGIQGAGRGQESTQAEMRRVQEEILEGRNLVKKLGGKGAWCAHVSLLDVYQLMNNELLQRMNFLNPNLPLFGAPGIALFFGGIAITIFGFLEVIGLLLGSTMILYYSERKATKKARMIATLLLCGAPVLGICICLASFIMMVMMSAPSTANPVLQLAFPKAPCMPASAWIMHVLAFLLTAGLVCFSKFWRLKRVEDLRRRHKEQEREDDIMRELGISPDSDSDTDSVSTLLSSSEITSDSEFDDVPVVPGRRISGPNYHKF